jgi:superfamily I DNA/RNA helicase
MNLTDEQQVIVKHINGNAVVVAGAGSGKTKCLIERTANLIENGISPSSILLFTFTKKAANEIKKRLADRLGDEKASAITACTIHSLAIKIIRENHQVLGYTQSPTIWTEDKVTRIANNVYHEQVNENAETQTIINTIKEIERSIQVEAERSLFDYETPEEKEIKLSENLHKMRMRIASSLGDSLRISELEAPAACEGYDPSIRLPKTDKMDTDIRKLTGNQRQMYLSLDYDTAEEILKALKGYRKDFVNQIKQNMRPIPKEISGKESDEYRKELEEKFKNEGEFTFVLDMAMKVLNLKQSCSAIEFDDMIMGACRLLELDPENDYIKKYNHIMVDEYQDVNDENVKFIKLLAQGSDSLMAVGDDDQAIYAFRGGNTRHILDFPKEFNSSIYYLTKNFRCSETIVSIANKLLTNNKNRFNKKMTPSKMEKPEDRQYVLKCFRPSDFWDYRNTPQYQMHQNDGDFKYRIFEKILDDIRGETGFLDTPANQIAILARNNFQLTQFLIWSKRYQKDKPLKDRIKFQNLSDVSVFNNKTVDIIHNWFNFLYNPKDYVSLRDALMSSMQGFGDTAAIHLMDAGHADSEAGFEGWANYIFGQKRHGKNTTFGKRLSALVEMYNEIQDGIDDKHVYDIFKVIIRHIGLPHAVYTKYLQDIEQDNYHGEYSTPGQKEEKVKKDIDEDFNLKLILYEYDAAIKIMTGLIDEEDMYPKKEEDINPWDDPFYVEQEVEQVSKREIEKDKFYGTLGIMKWLDEVRTETEIDVEKDGVILGTMHSSKGKEWKVVYLIGLLNGVMPSKKNIQDPEEERRLMYVGMTRAEERLNLCWEIEAKVSPFIQEIFQGDNVDFFAKEKSEEDFEDSDDYEQKFITLI